MAETWCGLRSHVNQGLEFFCSSCVMSSWSKTTSKSFVTKGDLMQQPLFQRFTHFFLVPLSLSPYFFCLFSYIPNFLFSPCSEFYFSHILYFSYFSYIFYIFYFPIFPIFWIFPMIAPIFPV